VIYDAEHFFDGYAQNPGYALETLRAAERGGADCLVLCDTNGGTLPSELHQALLAVQESVSTPLGIHTHNDSGLAVANALLAVQAGISHVQGTINGYGERCGNANLCTLMATLSLKLGYSSPTKEQLAYLTEVSRFVSELANLPHDERQPYVGASAFAHKGGAHIDGVRKTDGRAFEHVPPDCVGNRRRLLLSDQSGTSTIVAKLENLFPGIDKRDPAVVKMLEEVKRLEYGGYQFEGADASFELLAHQLLKDATPLFDPTTFRLIIERREDGSLLADATVKVRIDGDLLHTAADGDGPVNALDKALRKALIERYPQLGRIELKDYKVRVLEGKQRGTASQVRVLIESGDDEGEWGTVGVSENIIEASFKALIDSLEYGLRRILAEEGNREIGQLGN
jgi:2-isopropylmalate synthase